MCLRLSQKFATAQASDKLQQYPHIHYKSIMLGGSVKLTGDISRCKVAGNDLMTQIAYLLEAPKQRTILPDYPEREIGMVIEFLKHRQASTADEIAQAAGINRIEVFYCLHVLSERNVAIQLQTSPQRWILK
jgi:hypothetical protein